MFVHISPRGSAHLDADLTAVVAARPKGIVLPKAEGAHSIKGVAGKLGDAPVPILPIATETPPAAIFEIGSYRTVAIQLAGVTWVAEDLPGAIGAVSSRHADGSYSPPYQTVRALALFAARAANVAAIETVYPSIKDEPVLAEYAARGAHEGLTCMMALHPTQVPIVNASFTRPKRRLPMPALSLQLSRQLRVLVF